MQRARGAPLEALADAALGLAGAFPPLEDRVLRPLALACPRADLTLVPLLRRGWVVSVDPEGRFHLSGEHGALSRRFS